MSITIRRPRLELPNDLGAMIIEGQPEASALALSLSVLLPYLEPYLIRSMQKARPAIGDDALLRELDLFNGQEGQHYRHHVRFNEALRLSRFATLQALEAELDADYQRYTRTGSLRFNLAYAVAFEAFTTALAGAALETRFIERMCPPARALFGWHLLEELEHRAVAFDVYQHVCKGICYRVLTGLYTQWHLVRFLWRATRAILREDQLALRARDSGTRMTCQRLYRSLGGLAWRALPKLLATYLPWYSPSKLGLSSEAAALASRYSEPDAQTGAHSA